MGMSVDRVRSSGEKNTCTLCQAPLGQPLRGGIKGRSRSYDVYFCDACKVGTTMPMPSPKELKNLYTQGAYRGGEGKRFNRVVEFFVFLSRKMRRQRIKRYLPKGRILDIGCGRGLFLKIMQDDGWDVNGVEFDVKASSNFYGVPVVSGEPASWGFSEGAFDVVTMHHVLEHLQHPKEMLHECRRLLKRGGLLMCAVPNFLSLQSSVGKGVWFHLDVPHHIYHFTEEGLGAILRESGFRVVRIRRFDIEQDFFGWLQTLLNVSGIRKNFLYTMLKRRELRQDQMKNAKVRDLFLSIVLLPLHLPLALCLALLESFLLRRGGTLEFHAVKE